MDIRNEIKSCIVRECVAITDIAVQLADALGYGLAWVKRGKGGR